jgi:hypothetical protein
MRAVEQPEPKKRRRVECEDGNGLDDVWKYKEFFGLPWTCGQFIKRACESGHPAKSNHAVPKDLKVALDKHMEWSEQTLVAYHMGWCGRWLKRAVELEPLEKADLANRPPHVKAATKNKRLVLTQEIIDGLDYEDPGALDLLRSGSPLAGTREEVRLGWAVGPIAQVPKGSVVSRRFPLAQRNKTRMIDDYSISGVNDTASSHKKVDLHMVDTFAAVLREFFQRCGEHGKASEILAKTYDLKSAYRQVPIKEEHLQFSYFCIYNCELGGLKCTSC